jgi:hypothetical protein
MMVLPWSAEDPVAAENLLRLIRSEETAERTP